MLIFAGAEESRLPALSETLTQRHSMFGFFNSSKDKKDTRRCLFVSHKSRRSLACNPTKSECNHFCKEIYVINPKNTLDEHTPAAITYSLGEITYQSFGLDKKRQPFGCLFLVRVKGLEPPRTRHQILSLARLPVPPYPHKIIIS